MRRRLSVNASQEGLRLDQALAELVPELSKARLQKLVRRGHVWLDGRVVVRSNGRLREGTTLEIELEQERPGLSILHMDEQLLVVDKPPGLLTHSIHDRPEMSLSDMANMEHGPLPTLAGKHRPGVVHRLDRDTSGVIVLARTEEAFRHLKAQFKARTVSKTYVALCLGSPPGDSWHVDRELGPSPTGGDREWIDPPSKGKQAHTDFKTLSRFQGACWVEARPKTGRRHQVRLHLVASGLSVVDDPLYQSTPPPKAAGQAKVGRCALHATELSIRHPATGELVSWTAPLPADIEGALNGMETGA